MSEITLTAAMRANLLSLQSTANLLGQTQLRLATGNKVNSALDNPVNFFAAQGLNNRASDLSALLDGMGQGIQVLKATDNAIKSMTSYVNQLKSIANSAKGALSSTTETQTLDSISVDADAILNLEDGNVAFADGGGEVLSITFGADAADAISIGDDASLQDLADAINTAGSGRYTAEIVTDPDDATASILRVTADDDETIITFNDGADLTGAATLFGGDGETTAAVSDTSAVETYQDSYAAVITQLNQTAVDASYQGSNLIDGTSADLTVQVNEKSAQPITIGNIDLTAGGLLALDETVTWTSVDDIEATITQVNAALTELRSQASSFANNLSLLQTRQDFTTNLISTLKDGASALVIADKNEEGANLLALQTSQQLGIQALALSSQANQSVLRLFA